MNSFSYGGGHPVHHWFQLQLYGNDELDASDASRDITTPEQGQYID
ncbi:hypothetical protein [Luteibacter sp.]|jgi:hypothetical protein